MVLRHGFVSNSSSSSFLVYPRKTRANGVMLDKCKGNNDSFIYQFDNEADVSPYTEEDLERFLETCLKEGMLKPLSEWLAEMLGTDKIDSIPSEKELSALGTDDFTRTTVNNLRRIPIFPNAYVLDTSNITAEAPFSYRDSLFAYSLYHDQDALNGFNIVQLY